MNQIILYILTVCIALFAQANNTKNVKYTINNRVPTTMTMEELYDVEDTVVAALVTKFYEDSETTASGERIGLYVLNPKTKKFHYPWCYSALEIGPQRVFKRASPSELVTQGYKPCGGCKPYVNEIPEGD